MEKRITWFFKIFVLALMFGTLFFVNKANAQSPWEYHRGKAFGPKIMNFHMLNEKVNSLYDIAKIFKGRDFLFRLRISEMEDPKNWIDVLADNYEVFRFDRASSKYKDFFDANKGKEFSYEKFKKLINIDTDKLNFDIGIVTPDEKKIFYRVHIRNGVVESFFVGHAFLDSATTPYDEFVSKAMRRFGIRGEIMNSEPYGNIISYVPHPEEGWNIRFTNNRDIEVFAIELSTF